MKHIYIIDEHQSSKQNGVGTYIQQLLKCFENIGHDVNMLSFNSDEKDFKIECHPTYTEYHIPICGIKGFLNNGALTLSLLRLYIDNNVNNIFFINHFPCDNFLIILKYHFSLSHTFFVIHDQGWCAPLLGDTKLFKKLLKTKYFTKKNKAEWHHIKKLFACERRMYRLVDNIITLSPTTQQLLIQLYDIPKEKTHLIPNGLQEPVKSINVNKKAFIRKRLGVANDNIVLLYTGRTTRSKGIIPMLKAFEQLWIDNQNLCLVIAGEVFTLNEFAKHPPQSISHITYTGLLPKEQLEDWYQIADIGILPSYTEQSSYSGIEMLAFGKLIVTTDGHNLTDMFNESTAVIAHIGEHRTENSLDFTRSLTNAIRKALNMDDECRYRLQQQARHQYEEYHSFHNWQASYSKLINE